MHMVVLLSVKKSTQNDLIKAELEEALYFVLEVPPKISL